MATNTESKGQVVVRAQQLIAGTAKHLTGAAQATFMGSSFTAADITTKLQSIVTLRSDVDTAKASIKAKLANEATQLPSLRAFVGAYVAYLKVAYGSSPDVLADFGITPKTRAAPTVETKAAAAAKRASTRAARHTMGSKQRQAITGDVTGVQIVPVTAATPSVTAPSGPAAPATSGGAQAATTTHP